MSVAMLTLILLGAGAPDASGRPIGYEVRVHEMVELDWRGALHSRMTAIARPGSATVWVAPKDLADEVAAKAARTVYAPKPVREGGLSGSVRQTLRRPYIADFTRVANGPVNQATELAFKPVMDYWEETLSVAVQCRKLDAGVLTAVAIDESRLISLVTYAVPEDVQPKDPKGRAEPTFLIAQVQVPEVVADRVEGEWLIPHEHALIVSLGIHTVQDGDEPVVTERVAVITPDGQCVLEHSRPTPGCAAPTDPSMTLAASPTPQGQEPLPPLPIGESGRWVSSNRAIDANRASLPGGGPIVISTPSQGTIIIIVQGPGQMETVSNLALNAPSAVPAATAGPAPPPAPAAVPTMPGLPSRSLPTPRNAQGEVVPLPPLPPGSEQTIEPSTEPHGTPQTLKPPPAASDDSAEPKPVGPGAVSHAPTYQALGRRLSVSGVYRDGQGWTAKTAVAEPGAARSLGLDVQFHIRSCGLPEADSAGTGEAVKGVCQELAEGVAEAHSRLTTSLGIDKDGNLVQESTPHTPSSCRSQDCPPGTRKGRKASCPELPDGVVVDGLHLSNSLEIDADGNLVQDSVLLTPTASQTAELRAHRQRHYRTLAARRAVAGVASGATAAFLTDPAAAAAFFTMKDASAFSTILSGNLDGCVMPLAVRATGQPRHAIGLVLGGSAAAHPGRLPGTAVIRIPLGALLSIQYRDDMAFMAPPRTSE